MRRPASKRVIAVAAGVVFVVALATTVAATWIWQSAPRQPAPPRVVGNPANDKAIVVKGWSKDELSEILKEFCKLYEVPEAFLVDKQPLSEDSLRVTFPNDVEPVLFLYLVNYIAYPGQREPKPVSVMGNATVDSTFGVPFPTTFGKNAFFYVPADDDHFGVVYMRVAGDATFVYNLEEGSWSPAFSERLPPQ
jgi:hypothetical protein